MGRGLKEYTAVPKSAGTTAERCLRDVDTWEQRSENESNGRLAEGYKLQYADDAMPSKRVEKKEVLRIISPSYTKYLFLPCDMPNSFALSKPLPWATTARFRAHAPPHKPSVSAQAETPTVLHHPPNWAVFFPALLCFFSNYLIPLSKCDAPTWYWNVSEALQALTSAR